MSKKYHEHVEFLKKAQILLVVLCIIFLAIYLYYSTRPKITQFELEDECGPISGSIMHSIDDQDSCSNMCNAYCMSKKKTFSKTDFIVKMPCNSCMCYCKE